MKNKYVADTMALVLRLEKRKLSLTVKKIFQEAEQGTHDIVIPAMVLAEIGYLSEKKRIDTNLHDVGEYCALHSSITVIQ